MRIDQYEKQISILIVDDNLAHSTGVKQLIETETDYRVIAIATSGYDGIKLTKKYNPDIVLMDLNMPDMDGVTTIQNLVREKSDIKVIALTGYDDADLIFRAMKIGARGYILKTMAASQLIKGIQEVSIGKVFLPPSLASKFFDQFQTLSSSAEEMNTSGGELLKYLTQREKEVLELLTQGITYKGVAEKLIISETTVKTHVNNIFQKLQVNDRTQAVLYAIKNGFVAYRKTNAATA